MPRRQGQEPPHGEPDPRAVPQRSRFTVLVVDDTPSARYVLAHALQGAGYKTLEAPGGTEALKLAASASAVVLDVHLPDVHGFKVCQVLRSTPETEALPIIHVSSMYVEEEDKNAGALAGADCYFVAPVPPDVLVEAIDSLITSACARGSTVKK
jgi:CheY-like chemotaxis protein